MEETKETKESMSGPSLVSDHEEDDKFSQTTVGLNGSGFSVGDVPEIENVENLLAISARMEQDALNNVIGLNGKFYGITLRENLVLIHTAPCPETSFVEAARPELLPGICASVDSHG
ncbi:uncharacterized protein A4U43_C10F18240 [Asparagus officinalis]|uniref:Uncharacterized protein n=1 Tax=Asparagus officinalis TaxID=4686 RepID=A0A5P1E465_ASPOF|nr:uncharacterized protein A4U43_C10F18240 [Asparagus officinalis]